jgi:hypothetical protein
MIISSTRKEASDIEEVILQNKNFHPEIMLATYLDYNNL